MKIKNKLMKRYLLIIAGVFFLSGLNAQVNVFDCGTYHQDLSPSQVNSQQVINGSCMTLGANGAIQVNNSTSKSVFASQGITLKNDVHIGAFDTDGGVHLKITGKAGLEVVVMNYTDLYGVLRYKKAEFGIRLPDDILTRIGHFLNEEGIHQDELNPFLEWNIDVEAMFTHPASGTVRKVDGYYTREYSENSQTDDWDDVGTDYPFRVRFAPPLNGDWIAEISIRIDNEQQPAYTSDLFGFNVVESGDPGYVKVHENKKNLIRGERMIFPAGHNFPAPNDHGNAFLGAGSSYLGNYLLTLGNTAKATNTKEWDFYLQKVESYFQQGGRYIRTSQLPWSSLIEFEKKGNYYDRLHYAWEQDKLLDLCEQYDALMAFNMMFHTPFVICDGYGMSLWDWERYWKDSNDKIYYDVQDPWPVYCYNDNPQEVGGKKPHEALSNEDDLKYHEQRTRYYISRYGYSTKIYEFELLSEPFNVDANAKDVTKPYQDSITQEQLRQEIFTAIEAYHGRLGWYIKEKMGHNEHLIGVDYSPDSWQKPKDQSFLHGTIDVIGLNDYDASFNKYIKTKNGDNNVFEDGENSRAKIVKDFQSWTGKPVILSEFGDDEKYKGCTTYKGSVIDAMSMGFTGICGYSLWEGQIEGQEHMWTATIRAQYHLNGDDVINTLSNGNGQWMQGRQKEKIYNAHDEAAKELQYYISNSKELSVGYIRNRTYNIHTKRIGEKCNLFINTIPVDNLYNFVWDDGPYKLRLEGLKNNTDYQIDWYSFEEGLYIGSDCQNTQGDELVLHFPELSVTSDKPEQPLVWFVVREQNCQQAMRSSEGESDVLQLFEDIRQDVGIEDNSDILDNTEKLSGIYPNPFENYFIISSTCEDILTLQTIDGTVIGNYKISKGVTKIPTAFLPKGVYLVCLQKQNQQFKIVKQ
ncbi:MAG: hypothetical protein BGO87_14530 [Flavobacteriia bacterium 40-80]|nr:MAG: hypothetical protein BGO87_14530 [Flavobacteriia bacterium 40-80]